MNKGIIDSMKIVGIITLLISFNSCWQKYWFDTFEVINDTKYDVNILAFWESGDAHDSIFIKRGESYRISKDYGENNDPKGIFTYERPDSVIIRFDDNRYIVQVCNNEHSACSTEKNLIDYIDYYSVTEFNDKKDGRYLYCYTITREDYDAALSD